MSVNLAQCRICLCELSNLKSKTVVQPCMCRGTIQHVHQKCLKKWVLHSRRLTCQVCLHRFQIQTRKEKASVIIKRLVQSKSIQRIYRTFLLCMLWLVITIVPAYKMTHAIKTRLQTILEKSVTTSDTQLANDSESSHFLPLLCLTGLIFILLVLQIRYSIYLHSILSKDYLWCRRIRTKKRFLNHFEQAAGFILDQPSFQFDKGLLFGVITNY